MNILLTGGAGYIGSHTAVELINEGHEVIVVDNYSNSSPEIISRIGKVAGRLAAYDADAGDEEKMRQVFLKHKIDAVVHFAGYKAVAESVQQPLKYYENNLSSLIATLKTMKAFGVDTIIFSSSATVYGTSQTAPFDEGMGTGCTNPYGWTKLMCEQVLRDVAKAETGFTAVILRYFNPVGAHESGLLGEDPKGIPNNLMPYIQQVASGKLGKLSIFGNDYDTKDGTGIRDYIHVVDLAKGHVKALQYAQEHRGMEVFNLGTGKGYSVLEVVRAFERANGVEIPYQITARRKGDVAESYADVSKAQVVLGWKAGKTLEDMCRDAWNWQKQNPEGYKNSGRMQRQAKGL